MSQVEREAGMNEWRRQARWLRFADREREARFRHEWLQGGVMRSRIMTFVAIIMTVAMGLVDVSSNVALRPDFTWFSLWQRVMFVAPIWLGLWCLPGLRNYERLAGWVQPVAITLVVWGIAMIQWWFQAEFPRQNMLPYLTLNTLAIQLISLFSLPVFFRGALTMLVVSNVGIVIFFDRTLWTTPGDTSTLTLAGGLLGFGVIAAALAWNRESTARLDFARREQVAQLNRELGRMNAEKNEFMAAAAHDLRAPLAAVRGLAGQMRLGRMADPERQAKALSAIDDLSGRMLEVVNNYLGEHALESGTLPVRLEQVDLRKVISEAAARHGPAAQAKEQQVLAPAGGAMWARTDASLLGQVLDNYLSNALKFSPRGATVRLGLAEAKDAGRVRVEVIDAGPGISAEDRAKLFRKYSHSAARPTGGESSHGIGLAVTKRVAEAMGAQVGCDSEPGAGASFWVALPVA